MGRKNDRNLPFTWPNFNIFRWYQLSIRQIGLNYVSYPKNELKGCKMKIGEPNNPKNCNKSTISQCAISSKWTSLKIYLLLLGFSIFIDAVLTPRQRVQNYKFGTYMTRRIFDFISRKIVRAVYEKNTGFSAISRVILLPNPHFATFLLVL